MIISKNIELLRALREAKILIMIILLKIFFFRFFLKKNLILSMFALRLCLDEKKWKERMIKERLSRERKKVESNRIVLVVW